MSNQYFENNKNLNSNPIYFSYYYKMNTLKMKSDNGVFSKSGIDFGSSLLLKNINIMDNQSVLDVGCGIGIIGLALAKSNPTINVDLVDVNLRAINLCKENALNNSILNVNVFESNTYENIVKQYDLIVTNPPIRAGKTVVHDILLNSYNYLKEGGAIICVIQKKQGAESALKALKEVYKNVDVVDKEKGYLIIKSKK